MLEMLAVYAVLERTFNPSGELWLKAMRLFGDEVLPEPVKGERYYLCGAFYLCGATLSKVTDFVQTQGGYDIGTQNSRYLAKLLTGKQLAELIERRGFKLELTGCSNEMYFTR